MLELRGVVKKFGGLTAIDRLDLTVERGRIVGLIGPNGSGKTTTFNVITGFHQADAGATFFNGTDITAKKTHEIAGLGVGRTFQLVRPLLRMSVAENVQVGVLYGRDRKQRLAEAVEPARKLIEFVGLARKADAPAIDLVTAERKKLEVARALACKPEVILLDEVFSGLNKSEVDEAIRLIFRIRDELGVTIFMIEHVMKAVMGTCEKVYVLHHGAKLAEGSPLEVTRNPDVIGAYLGRRAC
jgi:branched-chain amino acid transport system ATP-binding protein